MILLFLYIYVGNQTKYCAYAMSLPQVISNQVEQILTSTVSESAATWVGIRTPQSSFYILLAVRLVDLEEARDRSCSAGRCDVMLVAVGWEGETFDKCYVGSLCPALWSAGWLLCLGVRCNVMFPVSDSARLRMAGGLQALRLLRPAASPALLPAASFASEVSTHSSSPPPHGLSEAKMILW